jgi:hypothetical protein
LGDLGIDRRIKVGLQETGYESLNWIQLAQDKSPVVGSCEQGNVPSGSIKDRKFLDQMNEYHTHKDSAAWS